MGPGRWDFSALPQGAVVAGDWGPTCRVSLLNAGSRGELWSLFIAFLIREKIEGCRPSTEGHGVQTYSFRRRGKLSSRCSTVALPRLHEPGQACSQEEATATGRAAPMPSTARRSMVRADDRCWGHGEPRLQIRLIITICRVWICKFAYSLKFICKPQRAFGGPLRACAEQQSAWS